jgi:hypothetical protein
MSYSAHCACGAVSATFGSKPLTVRQCWCHQCQKLGGGGSTVNAIFQTTDMDMSGELGTNEYTAGSGNVMVQYFCPKCGTPIMGQSEARPQVAAVRLGFLDLGHGLAPEGVIWTEDCPDWAVNDPNLESCPRHPAPPKQAST